MPSGSRPASAQAWPKRGAAHEPARDRASRAGCRLVVCIYLVYLGYTLNIYIYIYLGIILFIAGILSSKPITRNTLFCIQSRYITFYRRGESGNPGSLSSSWATKCDPGVTVCHKANNSYPNRQRSQDMPQLLCYCVCVVVCVFLWFTVGTPKRQCAERRTGVEVKQLTLGILYQAKFKEQPTHMLVNMSAASSQGDVCLSKGQIFVCDLGL